MIEAIATDLWQVNTSIKMMPGVIFPLRMVIVRLADGTLLLHSPISIDDALAKELAELGDVSYLIAPNAFHHLYLADAADRYPDATVLAALGVNDKAPNARIDAVLSRESVQPFSNVLVAHPFDGVPKVNEWAFYHSSTQTLLLTDLVFNIRQPEGLLTGIMLSFFGTNKRFATSKLLVKFVEDAPAAARSATELLSLDVQRVVPSHGDIVQNEAHDSLRSAFEKAFGKVGMLAQGQGG